MISLVNRNNIYFGKKYPNKPDRPDVNVGVIENFSVKDTDINGDGCPDYPHGKVVKNILTFNLRFKPTIVEFDTSCELTGNGFSKENTYRAFKKFADTKNIDYAVISFGEDNKYNEKDYNYNTKSELAEKLLKDFIPETSDNIKVINTLKEIVSKNKHLFVAGGNKTNKDLLDDSEIKHVNLFSLVPGIISVGSMDENFKKLKKSYDNPFIDLFAKGKYDVMPILENGTVIGYDITEDGIMDVPISEITGHEVIEKFVGRDIKDVLATDDEAQLLIKVINSSIIKDGVITEKDLSPELKILNSKLFDIGSPESPESRYTDLLSLLNDINGVTDIAPNLKFRIENGKVVYNPHKEGEPAKTLSGTSFAAPVAMAQVLNEKYGYVAPEAVK